MHLVGIEAETAELVREDLLPEVVGNFIFVSLIVGDCNRMARVDERVWLAELTKVLEESYLMLAFNTFLPELI